MEKLWAGRAHGALDKAADDFNSSISVDSRMYRQDIRGSMAHAASLVKTGILSGAEGAKIIEGLGGILRDIDEGKLEIDPAAEDIHSFVEAVLTDILELAVTEDEARALSHGQSLKKERLKEGALYKATLNGELIAFIRVQDDVIHPTKVFKQF